MFRSLRFVAALSVSAMAPPLLSASGAFASPATPQCIVSLSATATDTLFTIGAGPQVRAVDKDSGLPAKGLPTTRIDALNPSVEAIVGICKKTPTHPSTKPDLVIISYDANSIKAKLRALGVKVVEQDAATSLAGALGQIKQLGVLSGHVVAARKEASSIARSIARDVAAVPAHRTKNLNVYYEIDPTGYSVTSGTFVGALLKSLGVVNIADAQATSADAGYPQLNPEYVVAANPQLVFLSDGATPTALAQRPGFSALSAVQNGHVVVLNPNIAEEWGVQLANLMNRLSAAVKATLADPRPWR